MCRLKRNELNWPPEQMTRCRTVPRRNETTRIDGQQEVVWGRNKTKNGGSYETPQEFCHPFKNVCWHKEDKYVRIPRDIIKDAPGLSVCHRFSGAKRE